MMTSKREMEKLVNENSVLGQRLSEVEFDLARKGDSLRAANQRKSELLADLRQYQHRVKDLKVQLERLETTELEARGVAHDHRLALEACENSLRDKTASFKVSLNSLQLEIKTLKSRLSEREDKCDSLTAGLQSAEEQLNILRSEKFHADKENLSKLSNLSLALQQAKQTCTELTDQNEEHKRKKWELAQELDELRWERENDTRSRIGSVKLPGTPVHQGRGGGGFSYGWSKQTSSGGSCGTPGRAIPEETQIGMLQVENKKLKQELSCLQTNFQLASQKSTQVRTDAKEMETNLTELKAQFERALEEKVHILCMYEEVKSELNAQSQPKGEKEREAGKLKQRVEELQKELDHAQGQNLVFQEKMKADKNRAQDGKELIKRLESRVRSLKDEKKEMEGEMASLSKELGDLQERFQESSLTSNETKSKTTLALEALESKVSRLSREKGDMFEELAQASKQLDHAHDEIQSLEEDRQRLESRLLEKEGEIKSMRTQIKQVSNLPGEVETLQDELLTLRKEADEMRSKNETLERTRTSQEDHVSDLNKANKRLSRELSQETRRKQELARKIITELEINEDNTQALESDVQAKVKECEVLKKKLKVVESELLEIKGSKVSLEEELCELKLKVKEVEEKELRLGSQLEEACREKKRDKKTNATSDHKMLELESKLEATEYAVLERESVISDLRCAQELMEMENSSLLAQVTSLSEMVSMRNLKLESQQAQVSRHEVEVLDIMERISELEGEHGGCSKTISQLTEMNEALRVSQEEGLAERCAVEDKVSALGEEVTRLRTSSGILRENVTDLKESLEELTAKNSDLASRNSELKDQAYMLEQDLKSETSSLRATQAELKHAIKVHANDKVEMDEKMESLLSKLEDTEYHCEELRRQKIELESRLFDMKKEVEEFKESCSALIKERNGLGEQYEQLKESALSVLLSESLDVTIPNEDIENQLDGSITTDGAPAGKKGKGKGPMNKPSTRKPLQKITSN